MKKRHMKVYSYVYEGDIKYESVNDYGYDDDPLKVIEEQVVNEQPVEVQDPCYIRWQMFDEIPERVYNIECEGYVDKNGKPLYDEESIKYLTNGEHKLCVDNVIERYDENGYFLGYDDYDDSPFLLYRSQQV